MSDNKKFLIGILLAIGGLLIGLVSIRKEIEKHFVFPNWLVLTMLCLSVILIFLALYYPTISKINDAKYSNFYIDCRNVDSSEVEWMVSYATKIIPNLAPTLEKTRVWYDKNPKAYWIVTKTKKSKNKRKESIIGVFVIAPISQTAKKLLDKNATVGSLLTVNHVLRPNQKPYAYYIGAIVSKGWKNKYHTILALKSHVMTKINELNGPITFYTHPATSDGLRLAKRHGFRPVDLNIKENNCIYFKELTA